MILVLKTVWSIFIKAGKNLIVDFGIQYSFMIFQFWCLIFCATHMAQNMLQHLLVMKANVDLAVTLLAASHVVIS